MPQHMEVDVTVATMFARFGKLTIPLDDVKRRVAAGRALIREESLFSDPGEDYTALYLGSQRIGYWPGY